jgi:hypothetical protein
MTDQKKIRHEALRHVTTYIQLFGFSVDEIMSELDKDTSINHMTTRFQKSKETDGPKGCPEGHKGGNER